MTTPITRDEDILALNRCIALARAELAEALRWLAFHRDVAKSPAETITRFEASAFHANRAVEHFEAERAKLTE